MKTSVAIVSIVVALLASSARAADDQSTPKGTLKVFARATRAGDKEKLRGCIHAADGTEARLADAMVEATSALARLRLAAIDKFGEAKARGLSGGIPSEEDIKQMDGALEKIEGDRATVMVKGNARGGTGGEMRLVRVDGLWKMSVTQSVTGKSPEQINAEITNLQRTARAVNEVADEVAADKYKTPKDAADALAAKMKGAKPATSQPG